MATGGNITGGFDPDAEFGAVVRPGGRAGAAAPAPSVGGLGTAFSPPFQPPSVPQPAATRKQLSQEYAAAQPGLSAFYRSLPPWVDDAERELSDDLYEQMQKDDQCYSSLRNVTHQVLADGLTLRPAVEDKDDPDYREAGALCGLAERMLANLAGQSIDDVLNEMTRGALGFGSKVAEKVFGRGDPDPALNPSGGPTLTLLRLKPKPRRSTAFVVDPYGNLRALLVRLPGMALPAIASVSDLRELPVLPVEKFAVLTHNMHDGDPRGRSLLRAAYARWWEKLQTARDWMKFIAQCGVPKLIGTLAEGSLDEPATDAYGNLQANVTQIDATQAMLNTLVNFANGTAAVVPNGADVNWLAVSGNGEAFLSKIDEANRAIDKVITGQVLAGQEAQHGTRAQSETHQDTAGANLGYARGLAERMLTTQVLWHWVALNRGPKDADRLAPRASLRKAESQDLGKLTTTFTAALAGGLLKPSQLPFAYDKLGWPAAKPEELSAPAAGPDGRGLSAAADKGEDNP